MLQIVSHLEHSLRIYDCVVVPQLGGFVLQTVSASYVVEEHLFRPMHKEVVFNTNLKHNDGLLAELYMNSYGVSFQRAYRMVEEDVEEIKSLLLKERSVSLGNVGTLEMGAEGQIVFHAKGGELFNINSYGLSPFKVETWEALQGELFPDLDDRGKRNIFYIPVNRNILRGVASAAAAIALFLMISTPVKEITPSSYTASFIPTEMVKKEVRLAPTNVAAATKTNTLPMPVPVAVRRAEKTEELSLYYVVIASVKSRAMADEVISKVARAGIKTVDAVSVEDKTRIYADKFTDRSKAEAYMAKLRTNPNYKDAWIYTRNK
jgi:hypothetical protein